MARLVCARPTKKEHQVTHFPVTKSHVNKRMRTSKVPGSTRASNASEGGGRREKNSASYFSIVKNVNYDAGLVAQVPRHQHINANAIYHDPNGTPQFFVFCVRRCRNAPNAFDSVSLICTHCCRFGSVSLDFFFAFEMGFGVDECEFELNFKCNILYQFGYGAFQWERRLSKDRHHCKCKQSYQCQRSNVPFGTKSFTLCPPAPYP